MRKQKMNELEEDARNEQNLLKTTPIAIEAHCFESAKKRSMRSCIEAKRATNTGVQTAATAHTTERPPQAEGPPFRLPHRTATLKLGRRGRPPRNTSAFCLRQADEPALGGPRPYLSNRALYLFPP